MLCRALSTDSSRSSVDLRWCFRIDVDSRELPVKKSIKRRSNVRLTSESTFNGSTVTPPLVKLFLSILPRAVRFDPGYRLASPFLLSEYTMQGLVIGAWSL